HGVLGGHSDAVVNSNLTDSRRDTLMRRYADPVHACEAYCFAPTPTRCACATCLDRKVCEEPCADLADCAESDCTSGSGGCVTIMSEAVGASCTSTVDDVESTWWTPT